MLTRGKYLILNSAMTLCILFPTGAFAGRAVIDLCGTWEIEQGTTMIDVAPMNFTHTGPVPGIVNWGVVPPLDLPRRTGIMSGTPSTPFWYRKKFTIFGPVPEVAKLRFLKAKYGTKVWLNGTQLGEHFSIYTPGEFDCVSALKGNGEQNTLVVRVGPISSLPSYVSNGDPGEKAARVPGIHDSVQLILSGMPHIVRIQNVADLSTNTVSAYVTLTTKGISVQQTFVNVSVYADRSGALAGRGSSSPVFVVPGKETEVRIDVPVTNCRYWSVDDPFLYRLAVGTGADSAEVRFGMRTISFGNTPAGYRLHLNGKPHMLLGTNIAIDRFEDDSLRNNLMWRADWWRSVYRKFREAHWTSFRTHIGLLPEVAYHVADEEGFLIQDEYGTANGNSMTQEEATSEFTEWIHQRANHPCIYAWDQANESFQAPLNAAINTTVRALDKQNRPWQEAAGPHDYKEIHSYNINGWFLDDLSWSVSTFGGMPKVIDEGVALWLDRHGNTTGLLTGDWGTFSKYPTVAARRLYRYRLTAAYAENQRANGWSLGEGVMAYHDFVGLSNSPGRTGDHFLPDIEHPEFVPEFYRYIPDAFSPFLIALDVNFKNRMPGTREAVRVVFVNDSSAAWSGMVCLRLQQRGTLVWQGLARGSCKPFTRGYVSFGDVPWPSTNGICRIEALIVKGPGRIQRSVRDLSIGVPASTDHLNYPVILPTDVFDTLPDQTPPPAVTSLTTLAAGNHRSLSWRSVTDPQSHVLFYNIFRDRVLIASTMDTAFVDSTPVGGSTFSYQVAAVNGAYQQSSGSPTVTVRVPGSRSGLDNKRRLRMERHGEALTIHLVAPAGQRVAVNLFDLRGKQIYSAQGKEEMSGSYRVDLDTKTFVAGTYVCRIQAPGITKTVRLTAHER